MSVDSSNIKFLGNMSLNLWDCGGSVYHFTSFFPDRQQKIVKSYLGPQREHIFKGVAVLIFVFDVKSKMVEVC